MLRGSRQQIPPACAQGFMQLCVSDYARTTWRNIYVILLKLRALSPSLELPPLHIAEWHEIANQRLFLSPLTGTQLCVVPTGKEHIWGLLCCHLLLMCFRCLTFPSFEKFPQLTIPEASLHWKRPHSVQHKTFFEVCFNKSPQIHQPCSDSHRQILYVYSYQEIYVGSNQWSFRESVFLNETTRSFVICSVLSSNSQKPPLWFMI